VLNGKGFWQGNDVRSSLLAAAYILVTVWNTVHDSVAVIDAIGDEFMHTGWANWSQLSRLIKDMCGRRRQCAAWTTVGRQ